MTIQTQKFLSGFFHLLLILAVAVPGTLQADPTRSMSAKVHMRDVLVQVVEVHDLPYPSGTIRLVGECSQCGKIFRFHKATNLATPFYEGDMDLEHLNRLRLARARVILNTSSEIITDIIYVERGF
ncbi:MAG: hypothetical protein RLN82_02025 [Pseudomonadales bacterium]